MDAEYEYKELLDSAGLGGKKVMDAIVGGTVGDGKNGGE